MSNPVRDFLAIKSFNDPKERKRYRDKVRMLTGRIPTRDELAETCGDAALIAVTDIIKDNFIYAMGLELVDADNEEDVKALANELNGAFYAKWEAFVNGVRDEMMK